MNKTDFQALTLAGPTVTRPIPDPLTVFLASTTDYTLQHQKLSVNQV